MDLVAADFGIRQLHARFADAVWRQDAEQFGACFTTGGQWKIAGMQLDGRPAIAQACGQLIGRCRRVHLITGQPILEARGEQVVGRLSMTELAWMPDGAQFITVGFYHDIYREEDGLWRFEQRFWSVKYRGPAPLSADLIDTPDYGVFPGRPADDEETFVRRG